MDEILSVHKDVLGQDFFAYRNHVYRVVNFCFLMEDLLQEEREKIQVAGAFHDLGIWTENTFDYLAPSVELAEQYLIQTGKEDWFEEIQFMIENHHKITAIKAGNPLAELFRKADLIDVSLGFIKFGRPAETIKKVKQLFPNNGFHKRLIVLTGKQMLKSPLKPLPMMRW